MATKRGSEEIIIRSIWELCKRTCSACRNATYNKTQINNGVTCFTTTLKKSSHPSISCCTIFFLSFILIMNHESIITQLFCRRMRGGAACSVVTMMATGTPGCFWSPWWRRMSGTAPTLYATSMPCLTTRSRRSSSLPSPMWESFHPNRFGSPGILKDLKTWNEHKCGVLVI